MRAPAAWRARSRRRCSWPPSSSIPAAWAHLDLYAWNQKDRPGRPKGGEATRAARPARRDRAPVSRAMIAEQPGSRADYRIFYEIPTRWMDNDVYGHVNNVHYYSYFDTAIAHFLMREGGLDPWRSEVIGFCVESGCRFRRAARFPDRITAGLRVARLGRTSARYEIGLFRDDEDGDRGRRLLRPRVRRPAPTSGRRRSRPPFARRSRAWSPIRPDRPAAARRSACAASQPAARLPGGASGEHHRVSERARLRVNLAQSEFEVEGSEAFVRTYAERFDALLDRLGHGAQPDDPPAAGTQPSRAQPPSPPALSLERRQPRRAAAPSAALGDRRRSHAARRPLRPVALRRQCVQHRRGQRAC